MNERLDLAGIRDAAMNPPAGGAAGYEDLLWNQLLEANRQERQASLQPLRDAADRAISRSGWYNVGSMMIPHDAGEAALMAATGPGVGRLGRAALAGLGGMLYDPGEAEGSMLTLRQMLRASRTPMHSAERRIADEARAGVEPAVQRLQGVDARPLRYPNQYPSADVDSAFREVAIPNFLETNWLAMPDPRRGVSDLLTGIGTERFQWPTGNIMSGFRVGQTPRRLEDELRDELLFAAEPRIRDTRVHYGNLPGAGQGVMARGTDGRPSHIFIQPGQSSQEMNNTLYHEGQHVLQNLEGRHSGSSPRTVAERNPEQYQRYFDWWRDQMGDYPLAVERAARNSMYQSVPGEWEAVLAGRISSTPSAQRRNMTLEEQMAGYPWPDFSLRGVY